MTTTHPADLLRRPHSEAQLRAAVAAHAETIVLERAPSLAELEDEAAASLERSRARRTTRTLHFRDLGYGALGAAAVVGGLELLRAIA